MMSLRAVLPCTERRTAWRSNLLVVVGIAHLHCNKRSAAQVSSQIARALLATTCNEMKSLDEESAKILKSIKAML